MVTAVVSITLLLVAGLLIAGHLRASRIVDHGGLGETEREFHARRFRRRLQASLLLGVVGLLILGDLAMERFFQEDLARLLYWFGIVVLLLWLLLLAGGDWLASRAYYNREWNRLQVERTSLRADVDRFRREQRERTEPKSPDTEPN